jgi:hypothetical protein
MLRAPTLLASEFAETRGAISGTIFVSFDDWGRAMRSVFGGLLLLALSGVAAAQSQVEPKGSAAKEITLDDLQGATLHVTASYATRFRNRYGEFTGGRTHRMEAKIGPGSAIRWVTRITGWADTSSGRNEKHMTRQGQGAIGVPTKNKDRSADALWLLEENRLTVLTVNETGGAVLKISLQKGPSGLSCSATSTLAREVGAGNSKQTSASGGMVVTLSARPLGTPTCRIGK